jgi:hypothetical protein
MGMHIGMISLYAGTPKPRHARYSQADRQLERLLIKASVILSLPCPIDGYQHPR